MDWHPFDTSRASMADRNPNPEFTAIVSGVKRQSGNELLIFLVIHRDDPDALRILRGRNWSHMR